MKTMNAMRNECYMCRITRSTRVYKTPYDMSPTEQIAEAGGMFLSYRQYGSAQSDLLMEITSPVDKEHASTLPYDTWMPSNFVEFYPVDIPENDRLPIYDRCNEYFIVNSEFISLYDNSQSDNTQEIVLIKGDFVEADRKIKVETAKRTEMKYRIKSVNKNPNHPAVGLWFIAETKVIYQSAKILQHETQPVSAVSANYAYRNRAATYTTLSSTGTATTYAIETPSLTELATGQTSAAQNMATELKDAAASEQEVEDAKEEAATTAGIPDENVEAIDKITYNNISGTAGYKNLYEKYGMRYYGESLMSIPLGRMLFVHGMPFQYTAITDRRTNSGTTYGQEPLTDDAVTSGDMDMYGRSFAGDIAANMPIAVIVPGTPKFLTNIKQSIFGYGGDSENTSAQEAWLPLFSNLTDTELTDAIEKLMDGNNDSYQYYSIEVNTTEYFNFVNALCQTTARFMGLTDFTYRGKTCDKFNWKTYNTAADQDYSIFQEVAGLNDGVSFAFDPMSSVSDSMSNSTGESQFAGMFNDISAKARELEFMLGSTALSDSGIFDFVDTTDYTAQVATIGDGLLSGITNPMSVIYAFIKNASHGMNVRFPQLWQDSSFSKSYDLDMRFITPYATAFCKWRYVLVPFLHIFTFVAPQSKDSVINYSRPFLIKAYSRGYFNVEMGIIDTIQWKRFGDGDMIGEDGIPTQMDVSVSFMDLYQQLAISMFNGEITGDVSRMAIFFNNTGLMDLLGSLSGVNTNRFNLGERLSLYASTAIGAFSATGSNFMSHISDRLRNSNIVRWLVGS